MGVPSVATEGLEAAYDGFLEAYPAFADTALVDELRATEYRRLDDLGHVYLDYTGGGLYAERQLREHLELLRTGVFGNPHSVNPTSSAMTELVERARAAVLAFFGASPDEYACVFTQNATGALRLVGEAYPFHQGDRFLLTFDNHNSVNGIREFARAKGAETTYLPSVPPDLRVADDELLRYLDELGGANRNLFAFPAQSNFSGVHYPLEWIATARERGWDVLLDCAAFVPTNRLDLGRWKPDYAALSFYKLFGYPTGVGALLARHEALDRLERPWFSGGTIVAATVQQEWHALAPGAARFEDGTLDYLNLPAVELGLRWVEKIGMETIHARAEMLGAWLLERLLELRHSNGAPAIALYGPAAWEARGATIAFNFLHPDGRIVDERFVDRVADDRRISVRTGCFCNPGAGEVAFSVAKDTLVGGELGDGEGMILDDYLRATGLPTGGAVRASLGIASNFADCHRFLDLARALVDVGDVPDDLPPRLHC